VLTRQLPSLIDENGAAVSPAPQQRRHEDLWRDLHREMASWSRRGEQRMIPDSDHGMQFAKPQVVIDAVKDVITLARVPGQT
jgi:hypothetical protein